MSAHVHWAKSYRGGRFVAACNAGYADVTLERDRVTCTACRRKLR